MEYYDPDYAAVLGYDIAAAKADLAKSAYPNGFKSEILIPSGNQVWAQTAQILQAGMKQSAST